MRVNKHIAETGFCSRREADRLIAERRVTVNGIAAGVGAVVGEGDEVRVDGQAIKARTVKAGKRRHVYIVLNKPVGVTCTTESSVKDNIVDFIGHEQRIFPIGRLDKDSEGLLILTNDGELANKVMHPSGGVIKRYEIILNRDYDPTLTPRLLKGAVEEGEHLRFKKVIRHPDNAAHLEIHLDQGRKREIRRLFEIFGFHVKTLRRFQIGGLVIRKMPLGDCRPLSRKEIDSLFEN